MKMIVKSVHVNAFLMHDFVCSEFWQ